MVCLFFIYTTAFAEGINPGDWKWWVDHYGESKSTKIDRAETIFLKVLHASDLRTHTHPQLKIILFDGLLAAAIEKNAIILSEKALNFCYQQIDNIREGDSRLAIILGHEIAHLSNNDFWIADVFETMIDENSSYEKEIEQHIEKISRNFRDKSEQRADHQGLLSAWMAGYDPNILTNEKGKQFFHQWSRDEKTNCKRTEAFMGYIHDICNDSYLFAKGVELYLFGAYPDALSFFKQFEDKFSCREVCNNIGLVYYQMAVDNLESCYTETVRQYHLSTVLDRTTRADNLTMMSRKCKQLEDYHANINLAIDYFSKACTKDKHYVPARINFSSANILEARYAKSENIKNVFFSNAESKLWEAKSIIKANQNIRDQTFKQTCLSQSLMISNNLAIVTYLKEPALLHKSWRYLTSIIQQQPDFPPAYYNLAQIRLKQYQQCSTDSPDKPALLSDAKQYGRQFLLLEPDSQYAAIIRNKGLADQTKHIVRQTNRPQPPYPFNDPDLASKLENRKGFTKRSFSIEGLEGACYQNMDTQLLFLDDDLMIIAWQKQNCQLNEFGHPRQVYQWLSGKKTYLFKDFAVEKNGDIATIIHYNRGN